MCLDANGRENQKAGTDREIVLDEDGKKEGQGKSWG